MDPGRARPARRGIALMLVLTIALVLGGFGYILSRLTSAARREVDVLGSHMRAVSVAEACYAEVISRLSSTGWSGRWFRGAPEIRENVVAAGGTYSYLLRDTPGQLPQSALPGLSIAMAPGQADLLVRASWGEHAKVSCFWRLMVPQDGLDEFATVIPTMFAHPPDANGVSPADADPITTQIGELGRKRAKNRKRFEDLRPRIRGARKPGDVATVLGTTPKGTPVDDLPGGKIGRPVTKDYPDQVAANDPPPPAPPATAPWTEAPWRQWRNGGGNRTGSRQGVSDRSQRGKDDEHSKWDDWPGWNRGNGGSRDWRDRRRDWERESEQRGGYSRRGFGGDGDDDEGRRKQYGDDDYDGKGGGW